MVKRGTAGSGAPFFQISVQMDQPVHEDALVQWLDVPRCTPTSVL